MDDKICLPIVKMKQVEIEIEALEIIKEENGIMSQGLLDQNCAETCDNVYDSSFEYKEEVWEVCLDTPEHSQAGTSTADWQETSECSVVKVSTTTGDNQGNITTETGQNQKESDSKDLENDLVLQDKKSTYPKRSMLKRKRSCSKLESESELITKTVADEVTPDNTNIKSECRGLDWTLICDICYYEASSIADLESHSVIHSCAVVSENIYQCGQCLFVTKWKSSLTVHSQQHGEKPLSCNICSYKSASKSAINNHMRTHTKPFSCKLCNHKTASKSSLNKHIRTHTGEKPFSCKLCNYRSARKSVLKTHIRTHTGEKPFSCKLCNYKSARKSFLNIHMRTHTGEKPFSCKLCNYKSAQKYSLINHMKNHIGEKPFPCKLCSYKFAYKCNLNIHMRTHAGERPYS